MVTEQRAISDHAVIELLETKAFFSLPKIYRDIIRTADINDKERYFIYELFFDFLEYWRKGSNNNRLTVTVQNLANKYGRSIETIRRYLRSLEEAGLIRKILTTIKKGGQILTPIVGIEFVLPDSVARNALSQENRTSVTNTEKNLPVNNKNDHSPQKKSALQDNKNVEHLLDHDQIEELLDLIVFDTNKNNYKNTITKEYLIYILKRFKKFSFHMSYKLIKQTIAQMLFDLNKEGWHTEDPKFRLNIMLKMIQNNTYRIYLDNTSNKKDQTKQHTLKGTQGAQNQTKQTEVKKIQKKPNQTGKTLLNKDEDREQVINIFRNIKDILSFNKV